MKTVVTSVADQTPVSALTLQAETRFDVVARERLLDTAFGLSRFEKTSERFRDGYMPADGLAFSLKENGVLIGTIRLWNINAGSAPALLLGPLAVAASHEGQGLGSKLMRHALTHAALRGHKAVLLVGDAPYYARFGFRADLTTALELPGPVERARFLALELVDGALAEAAGMVTATGQRMPELKATTGVRASRRRVNAKPVFVQQAA
ncbi:MAG: GNAT family N-acetyltransferase [Beijerinckiaceae bacterium]